MQQKSTENFEAESLKEIIQTVENLMAKVESKIKKLKTSIKLPISHNSIDTKAAI